MSKSERIESLVLNNLNYAMTKAEAAYRRLPSSCKCEMADLCSAASEGLILASQKYIQKPNSSFITYADYWITEYIRREIRTTMLVQLPDRKIPLMKRLSEIIDENPSVTVESLCESLSVNKDVILSLLGTMKKVDSLDSPISDDLGEEATLQDKISSDMNVEEAVIMSDELNRLKNAVNDLSDRDKEIVLCHNGIFGHEEETLQKIADRMCITKERARQIEAKAFEKCKKAMGER